MMIVFSDVMSDLRIPALLGQDNGDQKCSHDSGCLGRVGNVERFKELLARAERCRTALLAVNSKSHS